MAEKGIAPLSMLGNVAENWVNWRARFENFIIATELSKKAESVRCATLLHYVGEEAFKIYRTFTFNEDEKDKLSALLSKFESHFLPKENTNYQRYQFFSYRQEPGQRIEQFLTELKQRAMKCKLGDLEDDLIKTMVVCGVESSTVRQKLLQDDPDTLEKAKEICLIMEKSQQECESMEASTSYKVQVDMVKQSRNTKFIKDCFMVLAFNMCKSIIN